MIKFEWDHIKAKINLKKHGVSFKEATTVFLSDQIRVFLDEEHSVRDEERLIAVGYSQHDRILTVVHCYRENDEIIRIISARRASRQEKDFFEGE
ncbi:MAG: BrnT family toxin [Bdellovibrionota bacterium]